MFIESFKARNPDPEGGRMYSGFTYDPFRVERTTVDMPFYKHATPSGSVNHNSINTCKYTVG